MKNKIKIIFKLSNIRSSVGYLNVGKSVRKNRTAFPSGRDLQVSQKPYHHENTPQYDFCGHISKSADSAELLQRTAGC